MAAPAPDRRSIAHSRYVPVLLFFAGFTSIALRFAEGSLGTAYEVVNIARNLAAHGAFANPFSTLPTGPTAHCAPLYPAFLALLIRCFGYTAPFALAASISSMLVHGLHAALLPLVSERFFGDRRPGIWAALIAAAFPVYFFFPQYEIMCAAAGLMAFCLVSAPQAAKAGARQGLLCGVFAGLLALLNPATVLVTAPWVLYLLWRGGTSRPGRFGACVVAGGLLVVAPWTWRNYQELHALVPIRDDLGLELYIANNDIAQANFALNSPSQVQKHPQHSLEEARAVRDLGEAAYNRSRRAMAVEWILGHRARFAELAAARVWMFWLSDSQDAPAHRWPVAVATVLSALALLLLAMRRQRIAIFLGAVWLTYPLLYYCVEYDPRYRVPVLWLTLLAAGYLLSSAWIYISRVKRPSTQK